MVRRSRSGGGHGYEWDFSVHRDDGCRDDDVPRDYYLPKEVSQHVMSAAGSVDTRADTVTIEIDVDEFNRGERRVSEDESLPPAAELRRGSTLTSMRMETFFYPALDPAYTARDDASAGCDYVVEEPRGDG